MDNLNENLNGMEKPAGCFHRFSKTIKVVVIAVLVLLLLIPMVMIEDMIRERGRTQVDAIEEVSQKWSLAQTITGPYINLQYPVVSVDNGKQKVSIGNVLLFPDAVSYTHLTLPMRFDRAAICFNLTDMRGINEQISIMLNDSVYMFEPGMDGRGIKGTGVHAVADLTALKENKKLPYEMKIKLKGSQSINFSPLGKTTKVNLKANWGTPSFTGNYLPDNRNVTENDFSAQWQVLNLNRNYSQVIVDYRNTSARDIDDSNFGVNLKVPVEQYQQSTRTAKYAILIILLTFTVIFFTEIMEKTRIHALQYLLVGLALCLFYSLLLSLSEHVGFNIAYLVSALLTIGLVGGYMLGIIRKKKPAFIMSGLLSVLYIYIFILIQLETFALLAGSLGLFVILAAVMLSLIHI